MCYVLCAVQQKTTKSYTIVLFTDVQTSNYIIIKIITNRLLCVYLFISWIFVAQTVIVFVIFVIYMIYFTYHNWPNKRSVEADILEAWREEYFHYCGVDNVCMLMIIGL